MVQINLFSVLKTIEIGLLSENNWWKSALKVLLAVDG